MKIQLIFDIAKYMIYVPDGYIVDTKQLQMEFFEWCETQEDAFSVAPGKRFCWCYSKELFLRYINEVVLSESREKAYFIDYQRNYKKSCRKLSFSRTGDGSLSCFLRSTG